MFERTALPAGPRVISARLPGARSVSIAAYVLAGSRQESADQSGVAHFMEHITFKGTAAYPSSRAPSEAIEGVGGSFNAATDRESTVYWVRVPRREAIRAMDVLGELIVRPNLDEKEIDGERTVIVEEIRSYLDDPAEYAQTLFQQAMFGTGPLGREICGDEEGIRAPPSATIRGFWRTMYRPANTVVAVAGDVDHREAVDLAVAAFGTGNGAVPGFAAAPELPAGERSLLRARRDSAQAQLIVGVPALRRDHPDAWIRGQEALHDRVLDLDEALAAVAAVEATDVQRLARELFVDEGLRLAVVGPARYLRGLERRLRLPALPRRPHRLARRAQGPRS